MSSGAMGVVVVIPSRLASVRLPGKPLADIAGKPMVLRVWEQALKAGVGPVVVACGDGEIAEVIMQAGGEAIMTPPRLYSGTDRVHVAAHLFDPEGKYSVVINLQGDLPTLDPSILQQVLLPLQEDTSVDMATAVTPIEDRAEYQASSVVKVALALEENKSWGKAFYFSRSPIPSGPGPWYHHIGIYAYRRGALGRFASCPQTPLEKQENLEQLRGLEIGLSIAAIVVETKAPFGVDTPDDLFKVQQILKS